MTVPQHSATAPIQFIKHAAFDTKRLVEERKAILDIHVTKRGRDPKKVGTQAVAAIAEGFTGAELEQAVMDGLYRAFAAKRELTGEDLISVVRATNPLSKMMSEEIKALRAWAASRARLASAPETAKAGAIRRPTVVG